MATSEDTILKNKFRKHSEECSRLRPCSEVTGIRNVMIPKSTQDFGSTTLTLAVAITSESSVDLYNGWASRMRNYLRRQGKDIWHSVEEGPHVPIYTPRADTAEEALGGVPQARLTALDIEKLENDQIAFTEIECGIPPKLFDLIQNCTIAQRILVLLQNMFLGTEEAKDLKLVSSLYEYNQFTTFPGETLRQAFTRFSIIVTRLLSEQKGQPTTTRMSIGVVAEHNLPILGNSPQKLVQYQQATQQPTYILPANYQNPPAPQIRPSQNPQVVQQQTPVPSYHPSQPQISYPSYYQTPTVQFQTPPAPQPTIQSAAPTLAIPAPFQPSESCYSEYDEAEKAAYQQEAMISQKFNRILSYTSLKKNFRSSNQNAGYPSRNNNNYQRGHHQSGQNQNRYYQKTEEQHQEKPKMAPAASTNQVRTPEKNETEVIKYHNCGGIWHYAADCRAPRNYPKEKEEEKVKAFVAPSGNVEVWSSGDEDEHFENKRKRGKCISEYAAEYTSSYMPKNYAFMVNHRSGKGVSIIEQVRQMLHSYNIYSNDLEPALERISNTCADALVAYQRVLEERDDGYDEVIKLKNRLEDRKLFCDRLSADLKIEQTSRTLLENSNQLLTS
ncbi:hypothetical protein L1887_17860 [Cichorium endivia]|nr:hypothetical protein L1887_17860 [Cichorium endivia]